MLKDDGGFSNHQLVLSSYIHNFKVKLLINLLKLRIIFNGLLLVYYGFEKILNKKMIRIVIYFT